MSARSSELVWRTPPAPLWSCDDCGFTVASDDELTVCPECGGLGIYTLPEHARPHDKPHICRYLDARRYGEKIAGRLHPCGQPQPERMSGNEAATAAKAPATQGARTTRSPDR